jgi:DNA-binding transcriptional LysR family regulator
VLDPVLLRTFLAVTDARSFTRAADRLGLRQSTVSQHVRRLEREVGRTLFDRDTHTVELTPDGQAMIGFARRMVEVDQDARSFFAASQLRGRVRFGVSEDFAVTRLPEVLHQFRRTHPQVDLELVVELSGVLHERLAARSLDLILAKRMPGQSHGELVWSEKLVWIGHESLSVDWAEPLPLILYPPPSITRERAIAALAEHGIVWRETCTSASLSGLRAALLARLGITVHALGLIAPGLSVLRDNDVLPDPGDVEFVLDFRAGLREGPAAALADAILHNADQLRQSA